MSIMGFAFVVGIALWLIERREIAATRKPVPCHACWCAGDMEIVHWNGKRWVHANGGARVTRLEADAATTLRESYVLLHRDPATVTEHAHEALPRHIEDEIRSPIFTPYEEMGWDR